MRKAGAQSAFSSPIKATDLAVILINEPTYVRFPTWEI
jgi:hypothetical protein